MHVGFINLELRLGSWSIWGRGWGISQTPAGCMYVCMDVCMYALICLHFFGISRVKIFHLVFRGRGC